MLYTKEWFLERKIPDEPVKFMVLALAYGAAHQHSEAVVFREAVIIGDEAVAVNYLLSQLYRSMNLS